VTAARSAAVAALGVIVAFHRAEQPLMTQVGYGIGDISTAEKTQARRGHRGNPAQLAGQPVGPGRCGGLERPVRGLH